MDFTASIAYGFCIPEEKLILLARKLNLVANGMSDTDIAIEFQDIFCSPGVRCDCLDYYGGEDPHYVLFDYLSKRDIESGEWAPLYPLPEVGVNKRLVLMAESLSLELRWVIFSTLS